MKDKYVFDSNIFINLHQRQPRDIYPSVWNKIDELMANGTIISSREVYDELTRSDDSLSEWAKSKKEYFLPSEIPIQERVSKILSEHRGLVEGGKKQNNADPFVIALAQENNCALVTEECRSNSLVAPKIPNICDAYGVTCMNFVDFVRKLKLTF